MKTKIKNQRTMLLECGIDVFEFINKSNYFISNVHEYNIFNKKNPNKHIEIKSEQHYANLVVNNQESLAAMRFSATEEEYSVKDIFFSATTAWQIGTGNCYETSCIVFKYIAEKHFGKDVTVEFFNNVTQDHNYIVLNRKKNSNPLRSSTWGNNCLIVDRWSNELFFNDDPNRSVMTSLEPKETYIPCISMYPEMKCLIPTRVVRQCIELKNYQNLYDIQRYFSSTTPAGNTEIPNTLPVVEPNIFIQLINTKTIKQIKSINGEESILTTAPKEKKNNYTKINNLWFRGKKDLLDFKKLREEYKKSPPLEKLKQKNIKDVFGESLIIRRGLFSEFRLFIANKKKITPNNDKITHSNIFTNF